MKIIMLAVVVLAVLACGAVIAVLKRSPSMGDSLHPEQEKYEQNNDPHSPVIVRVDSAVAEVTFTVNSDTDFLFTTAFDEDDYVTPLKDRWMGIPNIVSGDRLVLKAWLHEGGEITSSVVFDGAVQLPATIMIGADGKAQVN